jgi:hypothetical protein
VADLDNSPIVSARQQTNSGQGADDASLGAAQTFQMKPHEIGEPARFRLIDDLALATAAELDDLWRHKLQVSHTEPRVAPVYEPFPHPSP